MTDRFHRAHPVTTEHIAAELARELAMRRRVYPGRVADGRMTSDEMARQIALAEAWREDLARMTDRTVFSAGHGGEPPRHRFTWADRRDGLARELAFRARIFPRRVADGALAHADADHRTACLAALAARYDDGWDWQASNGLTPCPVAAIRDPAAHAAWTEWQDHRKTVRPTAPLLEAGAADQRNNPAKQKEMAL